MATRSAWWAMKVGRWIGKPWCGAAGVFVFLAATGVAAQQPGDTVRVSGELVGVVVETDASGLLLSSGYAPYAGMRSLEAWAGTGHQARRGFKYGLVYGSIAGFVGGMGLCYGLGCRSSQYPVAALLWGGIGGLSAGVAGSLIGLGVKTETWTPVPIPGGFALRLAAGGP